MFFSILSLKCVMNVCLFRRLWYISGRDRPYRQPKKRRQLAAATGWSHSSASRRAGVPAVLGAMRSARGTHAGVASAWPAVDGGGSESLLVDTTPSLCEHLPRLSIIASLTSHQIAPHLNTIHTNSGTNKPVHQHTPLTITTTPP